MFKYEKMLEYPINIKSKNLKMAKLLVTQFGGPDGELGASLRYLSQRFTMPDDKGKALLSDIGCEELGHVEMICTMIRQLIKDASIDEIKKYGLESWYTQHNKGVFPMDANGVPFTSAYIASTGKSYKSHLATIRSWARKDGTKTGTMPNYGGTEKCTKCIKIVLRKN